MYYFKSTDDMIIEKSKLLRIKLKKIIEDKNFANKFDSLEINNNMPFTFNYEDYDVKEGFPKYTDANRFGKSGKATAILSKNTISRYSSENIEYPNPINFEKILVKDRNKGEVFQRCHIIGYNLSAKFADFNNIFIGTENLNNGAMKAIENNIISIIEERNRKILYKVTPIYIFENSIIPFGVLFEYESIDNKEKINGCKFCYNIQKDYKINHFKKIEITTNINKTNFNKQKNKSIVSSKEKIYKNYYLNIKDNVFHIVYDKKEKCKDLKGVFMKYIQEVTGKRDEILKEKENGESKFSICEKCERKYNNFLNK